MKVYNDIVQDVIENGSIIFNERTGKYTKAIFGKHVEFDLQKEFPLVTSKKTNWYAAFVELIWYLKGTGDISFLHEHGIKIWDEWVIPGTTDLGRVYGVQWRKYKKYHIKDSASSFAHQLLNGSLETFYNAEVQVTEIDQIANLIHKLKTNPSDRRMIVTAWNPAELDQMQLPPCHMTFQCTVTDGKLNLHLLQRSVDVGLGLPFNWANYAMLTHMLAQVTGLQVGKFKWTGVDVHVYEDHEEDLKTMLQWSVPENTAKVILNTDIMNIDEFGVSDLTIENYQSNKFLKLKVSV